MNADSRDYDDACIVFLDGEEVYRSPNIPAATGTPYAFDEETLSSNHEASAGSGGAGVSIRASDGGHIDLAGTGAQPVVMRSAGSGDWNELSATGAGGTLTIRHANISGGRVRFLSGATGLAEDSWFHDSGASSIIHASAATTATSATLRRCRVSNYGEALFQITLTTIEECLFEGATADAVDFDSAPSGSVISVQNCTIVDSDIGLHGDEKPGGADGGRS